jgi:biotin operon repressor
MEAHEMDAVEQYEAEIRDLVRDLEAALGRRNAQIKGAFRLPLTQARTFDLLLALPVVSPDLITCAVYNAKVTIWRLRQRLKPWGLKVQCTRGAGYFLSDDDKLKIREILGAHTGEHSVA